MTVSRSINYGASLQAFSLWKYITDLGIDAELIDLYRPSQRGYISSNKFAPYRQSISIWGSVKKILRPIIRTYSGTGKYSKIALEQFNNFNSNIKFSKPYFSIDELFINPPIYDLYIAGSDQIWNPTQPFCLAPYFLTFAPSDSLKLSYAASIGTVNLLENEKEDFKKWLQTFETISVREYSAAKIIKDLIPHKEVLQIPDPTFLIDRETWETILVTPHIKQQYILLYTLWPQQNLIKYCKKLSEEMHIPLVVLSLRQSAHGNYIVERDAGPLEFMGYIKNAELVITDSFHGSVFSLLLGVKNFYSYISDRQRGVRIVELLQDFGLTSHLLSVDLHQSSGSLLQNSINHSAVEKRILDLRTKGRNFLIKNLKVKRLR